MTVFFTLWHTSHSYSWRGAGADATMNHSLQAADILLVYAAFEVLKSVFLSDGLAQLHSPFLIAPLAPSSPLPSLHWKPFCMCCRTTWSKSQEQSASPTCFLCIPSLLSTHRDLQFPSTVIRSPPSPTRRNAPTAGQT